MSGLDDHLYFSFRSVERAGHNISATQERWFIENANEEVCMQRIERSIFTDERNATRQSNTQITIKMRDLFARVRAKHERQSNARQRADAQRNYDGHTTRTRNQVQHEEVHFNQWEVNNEGATGWVQTKVDVQSQDGTLFSFVVDEYSTVMNEMQARNLMQHKYDQALYVVAARFMALDPGTATSNKLPLIVDCELPEPTREPTRSYVEFDLTVDSFPSSYAATVVVRGETYEDAGYLFYVLGNDAQPTGGPGFMFVTAGRNLQHGPLNGSSGLSCGTNTPLQQGRRYHIEWEVPNETGYPVLKVDGVVQSASVPGVPAVQVNAATFAPYTNYPLKVGEVVYNNGGGRRHERLKGSICNLHTHGLL